MTRPLQAIVNLGSILSNYQQAKTLVGGSVAAVVKANGYGHGLTTVATYLAPHVDALAVATLEEAVEIRAENVSTRLLVLEGVFDAEALDTAIQLNLDLVVHSEYQVELLERYHQSAVNTALNIWLKIDTGMGRLGFHPDKAAERYKQLHSLSIVESVILTSHFACADEPEREENVFQLAAFDAAVRSVQRAHDELFESRSETTPLPQSIANSAAIIALPAAHRHWNRAGIMLYGSDPVNRAVDGSVGKQSLACSMTLQSRLIAVRSAAKGESIGYGADFRFSEDGRYGIVACGYGDGYPRHAGTGTPVMVDGVRTRLIGRVSMDMLAVDLSCVPQAVVGAEVELWGPQLSVAEVAECAGTIPYELFTGLTQRVPRVY
ncbi:alanine racemase [Microbulbifer agarilyticus]|uniref:Alanine racemase n=1 Tax=Microbulbifer agarilyticus TaxID=260552 RepID=A0A1Q2M3Y6_9GAMM|nr:alanine racemase [Microbulbifer agarilyticus]AQQ67258.1 alanine racemase [Microbulbifer agarilyticus]